MGEPGDTFTIKLTGSVELTNTVYNYTKLEKVNVRMTYIIDGQNICEVAYNANDENDNFYREIDPGTFELEFTMIHRNDIPEGVNFEEGDIILTIHETILQDSNDEGSHNWHVSCGVAEGQRERIPEDIPEGAIMATIRNLMVEPVLN